MIASKTAVIGDWYSNEEREVLQSSLINEIHTVRWYRRQNQPEDPWISLLDHHATGGFDSMVYGEASSSGHIKSVEDNNGANVYIRYKG